MISIVIPLYNKEKQIEKTLQSVLSQTFGEFEVVVVNDGSTDNSKTAVTAVEDSRIRIIDQKNQGVSVARNTGIVAAKYDYIALLDADDEWDSDYLKTQVDLIQTYPTCSVFACAYKFKLHENNFEPLILHKLSFKEEKGILSNYFEVASCSHPPLWTSAIVVKRNAILSVGGFPVGITSGEDLIVWAKLAFSYEIAYSLKPLATFILDSSHIVSNKPSRLHDDGDYVAEELILLYNRASSDQRKGLKRYVSLWYKMRASVFLRLNDKKGTLKYSIYSLKYNILNYKVYFFMCMVLLPAKCQEFIKKQYVK